MNLDKIVDQTFYWIDENARRSAMALSQKLSRRNFLSRLGMLITGAAAFPLLPVKGPFLRAPFKKSAIRKVAITGAIAHSVGFCAPAAAAAIPPVHRARSPLRSPGSEPVTIPRTAAII